MLQNPKFTVSQEREVRRFDLRNVGSSILEMFNLQYGILFTLWALVSNPGKITKHYLLEGRLKYFSPFRLLVLSTALLLILFSTSDFGKEFEEGFMLGSNAVEPSLEEQKRIQGQKAAAKVLEIFQDYFNILIWMYIPFISFFSWLLNRKRGLNYAENIVFNTYYTSMVNLFTLPILLGYVFEIEEIATYVSFILIVAYYAWYYKDIFEKSWLRASLEALMITVISTLLYGILIGLSLGMAIGSGLIPID